MITKSGEVPPTDLEAEIDTLRELNTLRVESGTLRNEGIKILTDLMKQGNKWFLCSVNIRFLDDLKKNMLSEQFRRKVANHNVPLSPRAIIDNLEENKKWQVTDGPQRYFIEAEQQALNVYKEFTLLEFLHMSMALWELSSDLSEDLKELIKESMKEVEDLEFKKLFEHPLSLLMAARAVQALTTVPGSTFTKSLPYCYYLIIRELYTADAPDWAVGGTRANPDSGMVSALVTGICARALLDFVHVIENTSDFIAKIGAIQKRVDQLERMQTSFRELQEWALMEKKRLKLSLHTTIRDFSRHLVLQLPELPNDPYSMNIEEYIVKIAAQVVETAKNVEKNFEVAFADIQGFRKKESKIGGRKTLKFERSQAGHIIAESAIKRGQKNAQNIDSLFRSSGGYKEFKKWEDLKEELKNISNQVRVLLPPVKIFLSSVLDRELMAAASGSYGEWDVVEIACSAAAYGAVTEETERWEDDRLCRVADCLKKVISDHGRFPIRRPFHVENVGTQHFPYNGVVMEALAQILQGVAVRAQHLKQPTAISIEPMFMRKILRFFKDTRADIPIGMKKGEDTEKEEKKYGWCLDYTPPPSSTDPLVTALTVRLLSRINRMLDEYINARVLYYFSVKQLEELKRGPDLDTLFYPDYGLCQVSKIPPNILNIVRKNGDSIAILLQKMRAHIADLQDLDALYSMVLYGPGGTGKTTLVEALASSCDVPLVEVTPSDIVVRGVEALERRARAVFEALSLLTRAVILFDEFEPVLRKRKAESPDPDTVFSWLTPGMLPKLKTLHRNAKRRSVAYILVTNLIGEIDDAATRTGRFDEKIGIYPPDVLSRTGRFWSEADIFMQENRYIKDNPPKDPPKEEDLKYRLRKIIEISSGAGMEALTYEGYFRRPEDRKKCPQKGTPLYYYIYGSPEPTPPSKDASLEDVKGSGPDVRREYQQWDWVNIWDEKFKAEGFGVLTTPPTEEPEVPDRLKQTS